jgi:hypothetical protein
MKFFFWSIRFFWFWIRLGRISFPPEHSLPRARLGLVSIRGITDGDGQIRTLIFCYELGWVLTI